MKLRIGGQWHIGPGSQHDWLTGPLRDGAGCFLWHFKFVPFDPCLCMASMSHLESPLPNPFSVMDGTQGLLHAR